MEPNDPAVHLLGMKGMMPSQDETLTFRPGFETFYRDTWSRVYRPLALILRDHELARDAVDEAMTRTFQRWEELSTYDNPEGWVYKVGLNFAKGRLRQRWRELPWGSVEPTWEMSTPNPDLMKALFHLPIRQREVVVLRHLLDMSTTEVSQILGIAEGTVKSRLHRALERIRKELTA